MAATLARDLVRRRLPAGASPNRREIAPGRTLSPMPSEQKGAYGGHLASYVRRLHGNGPPNDGARFDVSEATIIRRLHEGEAIRYSSTR